MSRQAQHVAFSNGIPVKLTPGAPDREASPELRVLDVSNVGSSPEMLLEARNDTEELALLRAENADLRSQLQQSEQLMEAAAVSEETWLERQKEFELVVEEKSEVIRTLHQKIQQLQEGSAGANLARAEELERIKKELDERGQQLEEDEASLFAQMRTMEMALSHDRAELARQRVELQRLQAEIHREIEMTSRDAGLRERLAGLSRRQHEAPGQKPAPPAAKPEVPPPAAQATPPPSQPKLNNSGIFRRIFGG